MEDDAMEVLMPQTQLWRFRWLAGGLLFITLSVTGPAVAESWRAGDAVLRRAAESGALQLEKADGGRLSVTLGDRAEIGDLRAAGDGWLVSATEPRPAGPVLTVLRLSDREILPLPTPQIESPQAREPRLLSRNDGDLDGLVWLEGNALNRMAVRAARWREGRWQATETVSPPGPGTQIALTVARLADGSWLAAWAAFDGRDDEILWSLRRDDGSWSPPRPVAADNAVPDITPSLVATTGGGALAAWSRYDGSEYRVHVAHFDGRVWSPNRVLGPPGSLYPEFDRGGVPVVTYLQAQDHSWATDELDAQGSLVRRAVSASERRSRPWVQSRGEAGPTLRWDDGSATTPDWSEP